MYTAYGGQKKAGSPGTASSLFFASFHKLYGIIWPKQKNTALDESAFFEAFFNMSQLHNPPSYGI
jgi:hypothetical protein